MDRKRVRQIDRQTDGDRFIEKETNRRQKDKGEKSTTQKYKLIQSTSLIV